MKTLFLLRGLPGSGKTFTANLLSEGKYPVISADQFFEDEEGYYDFYWLGLNDAHRWCFEKTKESLLSGIEKVFVANTFTKENEIQEYIDLGKECDYKVVSMIIENRHGKPKEDISEKTVNKMRTRFSIKL